MQPLPSLPRISRSVLTIAAVAFASMQITAQQAATGPTPDVRLEAHDGKTTFYLGEPIRLDLVFENHTGTPFMLTNTDYGDLSEKVEITPSTGWLQWRTQSGHDYLSETKLDVAAVRIPVQLDEGFVFREPGDYRVRVTTARLSRGSSLDGSPLPAVTTNDVTITLESMPAEEEAARLTQIRTDLANAPDTPDGYQQTQAALRRLATLQGNDALAEKMKLLEEGDEEFRYFYPEAFASTQDLARQLALLEDAWSNPKLTPRYDTPSAIYETESLLAGHNLAGWQATAVILTAPTVGPAPAPQENPEMVTLLDSMPKRVGESRTAGAYFLLEFGGLNDANRARAVDYAIQEFPHMDDTEQHMLLETVHPPLRDPRLVPMLRSMLTANPSDKDAAAALLVMAPSESASWIAKVVCAPKGVVLLDTFKDAPPDRVPAVDACLAPMLSKVPPGPREEFAWNQRAEQAARFATPAILPALRAGWKNPTQDSAALAVLVRNDPVAAVQLLDREAAAGKLDGLIYSSANVYGQIAQPFPAEVQQWLRSKLTSGTDKEAGAAAYALSIGGDTSDSARVQNRLQRLRTEYLGQVPPKSAQTAEAGLAGALAGYGLKTAVDAAQRRKLGQGCMSDMCRFHLH